MKYLFISVLFFNLNILFAQNNTVRFNEISEADQKNFAEQARKNIKNLGYRLKILANQDNETVKKNIITAQLDYFTKDAKFQTGSISNKNKKTIINSYPVKEYLTKKVARYKRSEVDFIDIEFVSFKVGSKLKPVPGKLYTYYFDFEFTQVFRRGKKKTKKNKEALTNIEYSYVDTTTKKGRMYVKKINTVLGSKWALYFGDILVKDIKI